MRYWFDCEFIEDGHTIDLLSIGVVAEDGRELYAQRAEMRPQKASKWVQENVLVHLQPCVTYPAPPYAPDKPNWTFGWSIHDGHVGKINGEWVHCGNPACPWRKHDELKHDLVEFLNPERYGKPELWGYYADYDHVALCQLFGTMMDLPHGWPMYTRDIKQLCDELGNPQLPEQGKGEHHALADARWNKQARELLQPKRTGLPKGIEGLPDQLLTKEERRLLGRK